MSRVVLLVEEYSMKILLDGLLPRVLPGVDFLCVPHEGKQDLERSIPRKLRAWNEPGASFVVLRDNDGADCNRLKQDLLDLCPKSRRKRTLVRIACQELEAWYLGEPEALARAFANDRLRGLRDKARFRDSDAVVQPAAAVRDLVPEFQKVAGARRMARVLTRERNASPSFQALLSGIERLTEGAV